jgi:hypothetical protein
MRTVSWPDEHACARRDAYRTVARAVPAQRERRSVGASAVRRSATWNGVGTTLNVITALLAASAGVSSLSAIAGPLIAGFLALAAAALAAVNTALGADKRAAAAATAGNSYIELRDTLRQIRRLDLPTSSAEDIRQQVRDLTERVHAVNKAAPVPGRWAWRAVRRIEEGERAWREAGDAELDRRSAQPGGA